MLRLVSSERASSVPLRRTRKQILNWPLAYCRLRSHAPLLGNKPSVDQCGMPASEETCLGTSCLFLRKEKMRSALARLSVFFS